ncbi:MAG: phosphoribosylglycinamide formyltransferase [Candidatus Dadabacteria bacterium]|nr:phosphoribosylglycinamide formyltransferase [Candidatus Dadabacteria bacterium]NIQ16974.1 phosphoribosylglycinamide formyltransferase [Candidatus Dadabacteria bacterium]
MNKKNVAVFVSGSGTNLQAIIDAKIEAANIAVVVCNKPEAYALKRAKNHHIPVEIVNHKDFESRELFEEEIINRLEKYSIDLVVLAGFMRVLTSFFVNHFQNRIINLHPALLPSFPGIHSAKQALDYGVKFTGCTVHFVDDGVDTGPIILQSVVPVDDGDTEDTLLDKIHKEEHRIFPEAVKLFCEGRLRIEGRRVFVD